MPASGQGRAVLFWFYDEPEISANHLRLARHRAPGIALYGLYGGAQPIERFASVVDLLDDVWTHPPVAPEWAWRNGDLMLTRWFRDRGLALDWDALLVHQWDLVLALDAPMVLDLLGEAAICLPGVRSLREVRDSWVWVQPWSHHRWEYDEFLATTGLDEDAVRCCVFVYGLFTRRFFEAYSERAVGVPGFVEYRLPTLAHELGFDVADSGDVAFWNDSLGGDLLLNGSGRLVTVPEMRRTKSRRVAWHPVHAMLTDRQLRELRG